jgi:ABC-type transport system involved in multi-copper enzyme maturation permease subunit
VITALPLLAKELLESAGRRRTYTVRAASGAAVFIAFAIAYLTQRGALHDDSGLLGCGSPMFEALVWLQFVGVLIAAPAIGAGSFAREKERGTLVLLLLTPMRPIELVLQKWLSLVIEVWGFVLLAMPLIALTYAYGGFTTERLVCGVYASFLAAAVASAVTVLASAWCGTTVASLVLAYVGVMAIEIACALLATAGVATSTALELDAPISELWRSTWTAWALIPLLLIAARAVLPRRVAPPPGGWLRAYMLWFDRTIGARLASRVRQRHALSDDQPIAWRDRTRRSLTSWSGLARLMLPVELVIVLATAAVRLCFEDADKAATAITAMFGALLALGWLSLLAVGACLLAPERTGQTLDVLRTTPLRARDIVEQKIAGLENVFWALLIVETSAVLAAAVASPIAGLGSFGMLLAATFPLPLFLYFTVWVGLAVASPMRALTQAVLGSIALAGALIGISALFAVLAPPLILLIPIGIVVGARLLRDRCYARAEKYVGTATEG